MFTKPFWVAAVERGLKSAAQAVVGTVGQDVLGFDLFEADFQNIVSIGAGGFVLSILTSIISAPISGAPSPSLTPKAEVEAAVAPLRDA